MKLGGKLKLIAGAGVASAATMLFGAPSSAAVSCTLDGIQAVAPAGTTITSVTVETAPGPDCKIDGLVTADSPGPNRDNFRLQLPTQGWAKRYYFIGMGGSAGYVPTDSQIPGGNPLVKGFAVAGTDTGRQGHMLDWSFLADPVKAVDHGHSAEQMTGCATQQITRAYYGEPQFYRYMSGCSGGGRMSMMEIPMYPEDFDGVLLVAPGG